MTLSRALFAALDAIPAETFLAGALGLLVVLAVVDIIIARERPWTT